VQDRFDLPLDQGNVGVAGHDNNPDAPIMQLIDQIICQLTGSEPNVHQRNIDCPLGSQTGGGGGGSDGSGYIRPALFKQALHSCADLPRIFDHENAQAIEVRGPRLQIMLAV